jgi:hypothetical protein
MNKRYFDYLMMAESSRQSVDQGDSPDTFAGLVSWFKADSFEGLSDNDEVTTWTDSAGNTDATAPGSDKPRYKTNILNGKPVVRFTADRLDFVNRNPTPSTGLFVIKAADAAQNCFVLSNISEFDYHLNWSSSPAIVGLTEAVNNPASDAFSENCDEWNIAGWRSSGGTINFYEHDTARGSGTVQNINLSLGRIGGDVFGAGQGNFDLAELIWYDNQLSTTDFGRVVQYLKFKYNL